MLVDQPSREQLTRSHSSRRRQRPTISIVLATRQPRSALDALVTPLLSQCAGTRVELIMPRADGPLQLGILSRQHQQVRFVAAPSDSSIADLRVFGMKAATGDIVLIVDDCSTSETGVVQDIAARLGHARIQEIAEQSLERQSAGSGTHRREPLLASGES
jgi:hypothetical protein